MNFIFRIFFISFIIFFTASSVHAATEIKFALLAPEGSTWEKLIQEWNKELTKKTSGRVTLKIYAGGVLGDERDIIRKMRIGQVHAGAFTSLGLGFINPAVRVLDLPFMYQNYEEVDAVAKKIQPKLEPAFQKKGFVLVAWTETGFVSIFSGKPIASRKDMKGMKMWAWEGDFLVGALYKRFEIVPVPLALPDVYQALQTKLIDAVYAPPLGAIALQWFTRTPYITDLQVANSTGGIMMTSKVFALLTPQDQEIFRSTARRYARRIIDETRKENQTSYASLAKAGLKTVTVSEDEKEAIRANAVKVWDDLAGKLYPSSLLLNVKEILQAFRS